MTASFFRRSISSELATQFERQKVTKPGRVVKASLFCAIVLCLSIVPFSGAAGPSNGVAVIGPSPTSTPYGCTTSPAPGAKGIQEAISDAVNQANGITQRVVDASNCTTLTITSEIYVGTVNGTQASQGIKFIVPASGSWTTSSSIPASGTSGGTYALKFGDGSMIYGGTGSGEGQEFSIHAGNGSTLSAVCGNDPTYAGYYHVEGFTCVVDLGSTVQYAIIAIGTSFDESYMGHVGAYDLGAGGTAPRGLWVHGACCSATFEDINVEMSNISGTTPCVFGNFNTPPPYDANAGIHVSKLSCVHPGSGQNAMVILQNTNSVGQSIGNSFRDIFMEQSYNGSQDNTTPWVAVRQVGALPYPAADLLEGFRTGIDTPNSTRCVLDIGTGSRVNVSNLGLSNNSRCAIYDNTGASGVWTLGAKNSVIANYNMTPLFPGAKTVGSLPAANENIGAIFRVTDSTPITTEGQTCAGGGSNTALAFSNGTVWKCF